MCWAQRHACGTAELGCTIDASLCIPSAADAKLHPWPTIPGRSWSHPNAAQALWGGADVPQKMVLGRCRFWEALMRQKRTLLNDCGRADNNPRLLHRLSAGRSAGTQ